VLQVLPNEGSDKGGNLVHVWGHNFPQTSNNMYTCKFGSSYSNGTWLDKGHVICIAPQRQEGVVFLEISPDGKNFTNDKVSVLFLFFKEQTYLGFKLFPTSLRLRCRLLKYYG
jgi:hypothetical protein